MESAIRQPHSDLPDPQTEADADIIQMFTERQEQALAETEFRYGRLSRQLAFRILGDRQDAEECADDMLMQLWNSIPPAVPHSLPAYISALTRNIALNRYEERKAAKRGGGQMAAVLEMRSRRSLPIPIRIWRTSSRKSHCATHWLHFSAH